MHDVIFITPNINGDFSEEILGTLQLATILSSHGISCDIMQFFKIGNVADFNNFLSNALQLLEKEAPKIVSFYTRCDTYHIDLRLAELIKQRWPDIYIVYGGPQSDITAQATLSQIPYVDYICCGEGETTVYPFFSSLLQGAPDTGVAGLVYRQGSQVVSNPRPSLISDLDTLPMIDYAFFTHQKDVAATDRYYFPIDVGRGCPFGCTYCSTKTFWGRKYRVKSPGRIVEEIRQIHGLFGTTVFAFAHDMFTLNRASVIETCRLLKELDFPVTWKCSARLDCLDKELIDIMADAGMERIFIGIETGSPRMQKLINKNLKLDNVMELIHYMKEKNIHITASFIYGFPEETKEDLSMTVALIGQLLTLRTVDCQTHLCTFLAGTELSARYISQMTPTEQYSDVTGQFAIEECRQLIQDHPQLFTHFLEYTTDFRNGLRFFKIFVRMWWYMQPVYQYLSQKYDTHQLLDMYYDFSDANEALLETLEQQPTNRWCQALIRDDRFVQKFSQDENFDIITDFYRLRMAEADRVTDTQFYCFNPLDLKNKTRLEDYRRCVAVVSWDQGARSIQVYE